MSTIFPLLPWFSSKHNFMYHENVHVNDNTLFSPLPIVAHAFLTFPYINLFLHFDLNSIWVTEREGFGPNPNSVTVSRCDLVQVAFC